MWYRQKGKICSHSTLGMMITGNLLPAMNIHISSTVHSTHCTAVQCHAVMLHTTSPSLSLRGFQDGSKVNKFPDQQLIALSSPLKLINWRDVRLVWHLQGQTVLTTAPLWLDYLSHMEPDSLSSRPVVMTGREAVEDWGGPASLASLTSQHTTPTTRTRPGELVLVLSVICQI